MPSKVHKSLDDAPRMKKRDAIETRTTSHSYTPYLPFGSLVYTAWVLMHRFSGINSKKFSTIQLYGCGDIRAPNLFGLRSQHTVHSYFGKTLSTEEVLHRHSLFGYYSLGLNENDKTEWRNRLTKERSLRGHFSKTLRIPKTEKLNANLKWCIDCANCDQLKIGFGTWRVLHQLPFISTCPIHQTQLCAVCADCQSPLDNGTKFMLPGENCSTCGSSQFTKLARIQNAAYISLIKQVEDVFQTQPKKFRPVAWNALMRTYALSFGSPRDARETLSRLICTRWEVESEDEISDLLSYPLGRGYIQSLLSGHAANTPLAAQLVVLDAMHSAFAT